MRWIAWLTAALAGALIAAALLAPYVYAELWPFVERHAIVTADTPALAAGRMIDDYWAVQQIDSDTYAIGEPRYYQSNYSYLILGQSRALLFDAGTGTRNMKAVVATLTTLPLTVIPSHLHFDHLGGIVAFGAVALPDLPSVRADYDGRRFMPGRYQYLGMADHLATPNVAVSEWLKPGAVIDLGGRSIELLATPGHTEDSVSLFDAARHQLFAGDFIYPTTLYAFLPGASRSHYAVTTHRLLERLPADTVLWTAHCCRAGEAPSAPWLGVGDLRDLATALAAIQGGQAHGSGFFPRRYPVNAQMTFAAPFPWNNR
jgi:glyoxylase-like metal-dependent hydrolase (beta-lactamase superfamily II)